jgi:pimeloyl-ACP methyl ester carboxylesterase
MFHRRRMVGLAGLLGVVLLLASPAHAQQKVGVLMLHGKNPASNRSPDFRPLKTSMEAQGWIVNFPNMPWSATRYLDGNWDQAMEEIAGEVRDLRGKGATRIVLVGHSMGAPAALGFSACGGDVQVVVLLAPGHHPGIYYNASALKTVRESVDRARDMVAAGKGSERARFDDINQGRSLSVNTTAGGYLSYFDPASDADMSVTAPRVPATTPVLTVIGDGDPFIRAARAYYVDKLPANPRSRYLEVHATHLTTPAVASVGMVEWIKSAIAE